MFEKIKQGLLEALAWKRGEIALTVTTYTRNADGTVTRGEPRKLKLEKPPSK